MFHISQLMAKSDEPHPTWVQEILALPDMARLFDIWKNAKGSKSLPSPQDLPPEKLVFCMPNITVTEYLSADHIRYRLVGTDVINRLGADPTDKNILDFTPEKYRPLLGEIYTTILTAPAVLVSLISNKLSTGIVVQVNGLHLPMINHDGTANRILNLHLPNDLEAYQSPRGTTEIASEIKNILLLPF